jgi:hypothetical protein
MTFVEIKCLLRDEFFKLFGKKKLKAKSKKNDLIKYLNILKKKKHSI